MSNPGFVPLRRYIPNNPISRELTASNLNQSINVLDDLRHDFSANRPLPKIGDGRVVAERFGIVVARGPGEATDHTSDDDTTKPFYWVKVQRALRSLRPTDPFDLEDETAPGLAAILRATNLSEQPTSHGVPTDETEFVQLYLAVYDWSPTIGFWYFFRPPPSLDFYNGTTRAVHNAPYLSSPTNRAMTDVMEFVPDLIAGSSNGAAIQLRAATNFQTLVFNTGNWTFDYPRYHS